MTPTNQKALLNRLNIIFAIILILLVALGSGKNIFEICYSILTFAIITNLFLIKQPVVFFTLCYHALQATIKVFFAEVNQISLNELNNYSAEADLAEALRLNCIGLILLSCSIYVFVPKKNFSINPVKLDIKKLLFVYAAFMLIELLAGTLSQLSGIFQLVYKLSVLKWSILFLVVYASMKQKKKYYFISVVAMEVIVSMLSYFSTFKSALFVTLIAFLILDFYYLKIRAKYFFIFGGLSVILIFTWQSIKGDYRNFLSGGEKSQSVTVDFVEAYDKITDLVSETSQSEQKVINNTIDRISYIDFFAESIVYVPNNRPHTNGMLWMESLRHIAQPRLFFPNKKEIDDSQKTMEYTGLLLASAEQGTSISLGYMAESYVDFGSYLFVIPIIILGLFIGWLLKKLSQSGINDLYYWAFCIPFYFQFYGLEMASEKILGSIVMYSLIAFATIYLFKKHFDWLESRP